MFAEFAVRVLQLSLAKRIALAVENRSPHAFADADRPTPDTSVVKIMRNTI
ncbi:MAG: hypothetical protein GX927_14530 [Lentisphaerae bacterium]|nr:hypothetical protein [Lentisphaerota bacterium]